MKKSVNYWMVGGFGGETPVVEAAKAAKAMGYDAIELCFGAGELTPAAAEADLARLRSEVEATGIEVASLATGHYWAQSLSTPDDAERNGALEFTRAYIKAAAAFGVDSILVIPGSVDVCFDPARPVVPARAAWDYARESIRSLLPLAEEKGVCLALEHVWSKFLTGPFEYTAFIDMMDSPFVGAYFDAGNCLINGYPEQWIEILENRIRRVHVKNFRRREGGGTLSDFTNSLLDGDADWSKVIPALKRVGYDRYLTAEVIVGAMPDLEQARRVAGELDSIITRFA